MPRGSKNRRLDDFGRVSGGETIFFPPSPSGIRNTPLPYRGRRLTSFDRERSFDPLFGAVVTPFDRNHSIRYGRLNPAPFHIPLSSVNLPTCFKPSLSPPCVSLSPLVRVPIDGERWMDRRMGRWIDREEIRLDRGPQSFSTCQAQRNKNKRRNNF